jgi:hypothetical protein
MIVPLFIGYLLLVAALPPLHALLSLATWGMLGGLVYQDLDRTRMSRWWVFWAVLFAFVGFGAYLHTRNTRGYRRYAAPLSATA